MGCNEVIGAGIDRDCASINAPIGVERDLILVNYEDFDFAATALAANRESTDANKNIGGLTDIELKSGAVQYVFAGTDYSVVPTVTGEVKENGDTWFLHSIAFMVYSKKAKDRKVLEDLGNSKVIAIAVDRSTGLYELFGMEHGLKVSAVERTYTGSQNANFYSVTIATPDIAGVRESNMGELAVNIATAA